MWQGHLIRQAPSHASPLNQPLPRRVYTPTPDGFEHFLWACLGLSRGEDTPSRARGPQAQPGSTRPQRLRSLEISHFDRVATAGEAIRASGDTPHNHCLG
jgi:hypothetical protein